jgi:hypothetical protein
MSNSLLLFNKSASESVVLKYGIFGKKNLTRCICVPSIAGYTPLTLTPLLARLFLIKYNFDSLKLNSNDNYFQTEIRCTVDGQIKLGQK